MRTFSPGISKSKPSAVASDARFISVLLQPWALPLFLVVILSLLSGTVAYQAPPEGNIRVGWLGDRLFLASNNGLSAEATAHGDLYPDDLTPDSPTGRSRWTRQYARLVLPNLGKGSNLELTLLVQGWPADVVDPPRNNVQVQEGIIQPVVTVQADGKILRSFAPASHWEEYRFTIPASIRAADNLTLELITSATFTSTSRGADPRPKGIRLAGVQVASAVADPFMVLPPAWQAVGLLTLATLLLYVLLLNVLRSSALSFLFTAACAGMAGAGLAMLRLWMGAALSVTVCLLVLALLVSWQRPLLRLLRCLLRRYAQGRALGYGLVIAALAWLCTVLAQSANALSHDQVALGIVRETFPDSLLIGMLGSALLAFVFVAGREGLPRLAHAIVGVLQNQRSALPILVLMGSIWIGYETAVISRLPYVGHADYADNAVVARNLIAGRGWVVDYVTQFYKLYPSTTRPQETWPLLQPVWIAPFLALFGPEAWAAKIPNLIFQSILLLLIYQIGTHLWDRRVGVLAALFTLTNHFFFRLAIYTTSDLVFVVFSVAAIYLLYAGVTRHTSQVTSQDSQCSVRSARFAVPGSLFSAPCSRCFVLLAGSGIMTGLMMLQKPSGAMIAVGMGLWLLTSSPPCPPTFLPSRIIAVLSSRPFVFSPLRLLASSLPRFALWSILALAVLSPYLLRNMILFGSPVYSTEKYDAWVLGYRGDSDEAWNDIYRVFAPELGGMGLPDRSWILRWGFDYTQAKFQTQVNALRDYLMPAWPGLPTELAGKEGHGWLFSRDERKNLMMPLGAWLSALGIVAAIRFRRRLLSLLVLSFMPYVIFLLTYWRTNEERYFLMVMPWLALLAAWMIWAGYDRLAAIGDGRWSPLGLILVGVALVGVVQPSWPKIADKVQVEPGKWSPDVAAYTWLRDYTPPNAVIMTRNPWQLNWHARRSAVMIPNTSDRELFFQLADYYNAEYIVFENLQRLKGDAVNLLAPLLDARTAQPGTMIAGFELVYASPTPDNRVLIYRFPERTQHAEHSIQN